MLTRLHIALVSASIALVFVILLGFILRRIFHRKRNQNLQERGLNFETGISKLPHLSFHDNKVDHDNLNFTKKKTSNYFVLRRGFSGKNPFFSWSDHPSLVAGAIESGWKIFGFSPMISSSPSVRTARSLLGSCAVGDNQSVRDMYMETTWEISQQGSSDFLQIIRLNNPEFKKQFSTNHVGVCSVVRTSLPLPGPSLGDSSSFPQEAYFEITILSLGHQNYSGLKVQEDQKVSEGEKMKLIKEDYNAKMNSSSEGLGHVSSTHRYGDKGIDEMKHARKENGKVEASIILSVGLTVGGGTASIKLPGTYPASIGFNSNGSVFLDGIKLVLESQMQEWEKPEKVIGCGYNPSKRKVYFTVDSQLVHEIHCKSDAFSTPLYPTLAANVDITAVVNLGQSVFKYAPANLQRTPNPCFSGPLVKSPTLGFDSGELFSMRRVDSHQWLNRNNTISMTNGTVSRGLDYDDESDGDLFEINLERSGRSPYRYQ